MPAALVALRSFSHVYGINVLMPTAYLEPGVVQVMTAPIAGGLDIGRYPGGSDATAVAIARALTASPFSPAARPAITRLTSRNPRPTPGWGMAFLGGILGFG